MERVLVVGDSRMSCAKRSLSQNYVLTYLPSPGANLKMRIDLANEHIDENVRVIVVLGLHCDITELREKGKGLMVMKRFPPISEIVNKLATWDYYWRGTCRIESFWDLPYIPNFLWFNMRRMKCPGIGPLPCG